jgi:hypothetical protein
MLLVVRTNATIVRATPPNGRVVTRDLFRRLEKDLAGAPIVIDIVSQKHPFGAMLMAAFQHPDPAILEDDLRIYPAKTSGAD